MNVPQSYRAHLPSNKEFVTDPDNCCQKAFGDFIIKKDEAEMVDSNTAVQKERNISYCY